MLQLKKTCFGCNQQSWKFPEVCLKTPGLVVRFMAGYAVNRNAAGNCPDVSLVISCHVTFTNVETPQPLVKAN